MLFFLNLKYLFMKTKSLALFLILMFVISSCKISFTNSIRSQIGSDSLIQSNLQFYNSSKIRLVRVVSSSSDDKIKKGVVNSKSDVNINIIKISRHTPGVCIDIKKDIFFVSFDNSNDNTLKFYLDTISERYKLLKVTGNTIAYDNKIYKIERGSTVQLKIKRKFESSVNVDRKRLSGRKIDK